MLKVNNKNALNRITKGMVRENKTRNLTAVLAIMITTFMLFCVFGLGLGIINGYKEQSLQYRGTTAEASLGFATPEQVALINSMDYVEKTAKGWTAAMYDDGEYIVVFLAGDENYYEFVEPCLGGLKGSIPLKENEVVVSQNVLEMLGIKKPKQGMEIELSYYTNFDHSEQEPVYEKRTFTLTGWYTDMMMMGTTNGVVYTSEAFAVSTGSLLEEKGSVQILFDGEEELEIYKERLEKDLDLGIDQNISVLTDMSYSREQFSTGAGVALIAVLVMICAYLLIYNVFYISVIKDIRFYGLLKTIGTSSVQLKKIVMKQAMILSAVGIPAGLGLGVLGMGVLKGVITIDMGSFSFLNPAAILLSIVFSLFTVWISVRKSSKKASEISPIEAVRFSGAEVDHKKGKNSTDGGKLYRMAWRNVFRDKKRAIIVMISLFTGLTLFSVVLTLVNALEPENMILSQTQADFGLRSEFEEYGDGQKELILEDHFDEDFMEQIDQLEGIKDYYVTYTAPFRLEYNENFSAFLKYMQKDLGLGSKYTSEVLNEYFYGTLAGVEREVLEELYPEEVKKLDMDAYERGELALRHLVYANEYDFPETIQMKSMLNDREREINISVVDTHIFGSYLGGGEAPTLLVSPVVTEEFGEQKYISGIWIEADENSEEQLQEDLVALIEDNNYINLESRYSMREGYEFMNILLMAIGGALTSILAFVGIVNFINIMVTSVEARKLELSVMESIGMTGKQVRKMLMLEGICYGGVSLGLVWTVGAVLSYLIFVLFKSSVYYAVFSYPLAGMIIMSLLILVICIGAPIMNYRNFNKKSLTERIREAE